MNNIITYFYIEDTNKMSSYGVQEKNYYKKNEYYFRCIVNFFCSSINKNSECKHWFVVNDIKKIQFINGFDFVEFCKNNNIELIEKKSNNVIEREKWAGSMYFFDVIEYFYDTNVPNDNYMFFDNDMFFTSNLSKRINEYEYFDYLIYDITHEYKKNGEWSINFNGIDINDMNKNFIPCGGEFFALKGKNIKNFIDNYNFIKLKNTKLITEEHYISTITAEFLRNKFVVKNVNGILKRCWTTLKYKNIKKNDCNFTILHMPSEKEFGIYWYNKKNIRSLKYDKDLLMKYCGILKRPIILTIRIFFKKIKNKIHILK